MSEANGNSPLQTPPLPAAVPSPRVEGPLTTGRPLRPIALAVITAVLIALCAFLAWPYMSALVWALALAIIAWPLHAWLSRHVRLPWLAAGISTVTVLLLVLVPLLFVSYQLAREASSAAEKMQNDEAQGVLKDTVEKTPFRGVNDWADRMNLDIDRQAREFVGSYTKDPNSLVQGSIWAVIQAAVAVFILYYLFKDRGTMTRGVHTLLPLTKDEGDQVMKRVADVVRANLYANVVTSLIAATGGGIMFYLTGVPSPVLWAVVMFVISLLPVLGSFMIWAPAVVYLAATDHWPQALALGTWGLLNSILVDNVLYIRVAGNRMHLHQVPSLLAILGGMTLFGAAGIVLGPTVLAVTVAILEVWHRRATATSATPTVIEHAPDGGPIAGVVVPRSDRPDPAPVSPQVHV
jgi:predicted PurR-regulated permease PerM